MKTFIRVRHERVQQWTKWADGDYQTYEAVYRLDLRTMSNYDLCPRCGGDGVIPKPEAMRNKRKKARKGLNDTARKMGISAAYLCDLEHGRRAWSSELIELFNKALE